MVAPRHRPPQSFSWRKGSVPTHSRPGVTPAQAAVIEQLRASSLFGNVVIVRGSDALKAAVDVWGSHGDRQPLLTQLEKLLL